jgi:spermidine synthase
MTTTRARARSRPAVADTPWSARAISLAFFVSGAAGLIFEVVWVHRFGLVFGQSVGATSIVLSSFMGGLALGTALVGRYGRRLGNLLRTYAALEILVAAAGVGLTYLLPMLPMLTAPLAAIAGSRAWLVGLTRLVVSFGALLIPTTAMGATLPVLIGSRPAGRWSFGRALGQLYGWNTLGAVCGALVAELVLIDRAGVAGTAWVAALLNLGAAGAALVLSRRADGDAGTEAPAVVVRSPSTADEAPRDARRVALLTCAALSGAALLALEVVWFRFLSMYVLTTTLTMSVLLAVVLAGIGLGGLAASRWLVRGLLSCASVAFMAGCSTTLAYLAFQWLTRGTQIAEWYRVAWLACALTAPTSFMSGVLFTAFGHALHRSTVQSGTRDEVRAAAWLTLANTSGAMCGAPIAAFVLLPLLGMERSLFAISALYAVVGALAMRFESRVARSAAFLLSAVVVVLALGAFPFGLMAGTYFPRVAQAYAGDGSAILATREGSSETIFLMQQQWLGQPVYSRLVTNGFSMTGTSMPALRYMRYFAYWPMLLHQAPLRRALVICYGAGVTAGAALDLPAVDTVDIVELSPDIVSMSDIIYAPDRHPLHDPRARLHIEDGRVFLQTSQDRFDLITGEPPPPRTPGAANIYTREYFHLVYDRLAEGGMTTYWVPVARPDPGTDVNTIIRAFCDVFDDCSLWNATPFDFMLVGTRHATGPVSEAAFGAAWSRPAMAARLSEIGLEEPEQIGATFIGDAPFLRQLTGGAPPLTDDFPHRLRPVDGRASLSDPRYLRDPAVFQMYQRALDPVRAREAFAASDFVKRLWPRMLISGSLRRFDEQRIMNRVLLEGGRPLAQIEELHALLTGTSLKTLPLWFLGSDDVKERIAEASAERSGATEYARALRALVARDYRRAAAYFGESERRGLQGETVRPLQAYALCLAGDLDTARLLARGSVARTDAERHFWNWLRATYGVERSAGL